MRAVKRTGRPTISSPISSNSKARANTTTRPEISSSRSRWIVARNINRSDPSDKALSLGVTVTAAEVPNAALIGWLARASVRSAIAIPKPAPTTPTVTRPALTAHGHRLDRGRRSVIHHNTPAPSASSRHPDAHARPTGQTIPAAVTIQLVSAPGTRRTYSRSATSRPAPAIPLCTGVRRAPGTAASAVAPDRCRQLQQAGPRW